MNRRRLCQLAVVGALGSLAGCVDALEESFQGVVPIEIHNEATDTYTLQFEAFERESNRQTYDEGIAVSPSDDTVSPAHLNAIDQRLRVVQFDASGETELESHEATITPSAQLVFIEVDDEEMTLEVRRGENADEEDTALENESESTER